MAKARPQKAVRLTDTFDTDAGTQVGDLVRIISPGTVQNFSDNLATTIQNGAFGIGFSKPSATRIEVLFVGLIDGFAGLTPGSPLYISPAGVPTHTEPTTEMLQQIGFATRTTEMFLFLQQPIDLGP